MMMTLQQGLAGESVRQLQTELQSRGFGPDTIDGDFGAATSAAVIAFQKSENLPADGIAGPDTLSALGLDLHESESSAVASNNDLTSTLFVDDYQFDNHASAQQITDCTTAFAERCLPVTARKMMLYGKGARMFKSMNNTMACDTSWHP